MQGLLDFLKRYSHLFLFALLEGGGLLLFFRFNFYQGSVWFTSANAFSGAIKEWEAGILSYASLGERNKVLMERNIVLEKRVAALSHMLEDAGHDSTATEIRQAELLADFDMIPAEVVDNSITKHDNYLTINKGLADGVRPEMGVVCGTGAVGIVYQASPHYAIVMPLLNNKSNVSCRLRGTGYFGYLRWEGGHPLYATLGDIPRHARIRKGMAVETSGFSAVFPAGLFVGNVAGVENSEDGLSYEVRVNLGTDFARLRDVCVLPSSGKAEIDSLQRAATVR